MPTRLNAALSAGHYLHWGVVNVSLTNLTIVVVMVAVFVAALLLPFPHPHEPRADGHPRGDRP